MVTIRIPAPRKWHLPYLNPFWSGVVVLIALAIIGGVVVGIMMMSRASVTTPAPREVLPKAEPGPVVPPNAHLIKPPKVQIPPGNLLQLPSPQEATNTSDPRVLAAYVIQVETLARLEGKETPASNLLTRGNQEIFTEWDRFLKGYKRGALGIPNAVLAYTQPQKMEFSTKVTLEGMFILEENVQAALYWFEGGVTGVVNVYLWFEWDFEKGQWVLTTIKPLEG